MTYFDDDSLDSGRIIGVFDLCKRAFDFLICLALLPLLALTAVALLILNPFKNKGPLMFRQKRMGQFCQPFTALKFRTMSDATGIARSADMPLEHDRITPLGKFLRKTRLDELPQIINVLMGDMSFVGPRPDYYEFALHYVDAIPGYAKRHRVLPGMTGLAQTEVGYVESTDATRRKVHADLYYIANSGFKLEMYVLWRTLVVIFTKKGS